MANETDERKPITEETVLVVARYAFQMGTQNPKKNFYATATGMIGWEEMVVDLVKEFLSARDMKDK